MTLSTLSQVYLPAIEGELRQAVALTDLPGLEELHQMLAYHMGWAGDDAGPGATGKRIRPLLVLLTTSSAGGDWQHALPAAAAVELIHNFSLIHDDIEDDSPLRRGRPTVWKKWGIPQALNSGDTLFTIAHLALLRLEETCPHPITLQATRILQETCLHLTQGQFLDISYADRPNLPVEAYWPMVSGKTAALLAACAELGALIASAGSTICQRYRAFGRLLGLAFQAQDDLLGIWGDASVTGKSAESDLVTGKKSLPVLYGLGLNGPFAERWRQGKITVEEVPAIAFQLEAEGARQYTVKTADQLTVEALQALEATQPAGEAGLALHELVNRLLRRQV